MPELPEVESLRRSLLPYILDQKITKVEVLLPKLVSSKGTARQESSEKTQEFISGLENSQIKKLTRRAKNMIFELDTGGILLVHLKMTGQLVFKDKNHLITGGHPIQDSETTLPNKHSYVIFHLENGTLYYNDVRKFGYLLYFSSKIKLDDEEHFGDLGMEPLEESFNEEEFKKRLKTKSGNLKKLFLDQKVVVGLGNIYADEVCFTAGVLPTRNVKSLNDKEIKKLFRAIKIILVKAVDLGGSSIANYLLGDGSRGNYAHHHKVYGRGGKPCLVCGNTLSVTQLAGRTTVFCTVCQK